MAADAAAAARRRRRLPDLVELFCGVGAHTMCLAPAFRRVLCVDVNPALVAQLRANAALNSRTRLVDAFPSDDAAPTAAAAAGSIVVDAASPISVVGDAADDDDTQSPPPTEILARCDDAARWARRHADAGARIRGVDVATAWLLLDPPRAGLDAASRALALRFRNVLYVSCNPLALRRDLDWLGARGLAPRQWCVLDHFPGSGHVENAVWLRPASPSSS